MSSISGHPILAFVTAYLSFGFVFLTYWNCNASAVDGICEMDSSHVALRLILGIAGTLAVSAAVVFVSNDVQPRVWLKLTANLIVVIEGIILLVLLVYTILHVPQSSDFIAATATTLTVFLAICLDAEGAVACLRRVRTPRH